MNFKVTLVVLALIGQTDAAWKLSDKVFTSGYGLGTTSGKSESSFTSREKTYGFVKRIKVCSDTFNAKIDWDLGNICGTDETLKYNVVVGDDTYFSSSRCEDKKLAVKQDECINAVYFWTKGSQFTSEVTGLTYYTTSGATAVVGATTGAGKWLLPTNYVASATASLASSSSTSSAGCYTWNNKQWVGTSPYNPVNTECGLSTCTECTSTTTATVTQTQSCLTSFQIETFLDEITNAAVYYNEAIPTYNSQMCVSERSSAGGAIGGSVVGVLFCMGCCGGLIWFFFIKGKESSGGTNAGTDLATVVEETPQQTVTTTMMMQQPQVMMQPQAMMMPGMMAQPQMMDPMMMQQQQMMMQPGMVAQPQMMQPGMIDPMTGQPMMAQQQMIDPMTGQPMMAQPGMVAQPQMMM